MNAPNRPPGPVHTFKGVDKDRPLVVFENLTVRFPSREGEVLAVDAVSFEVPRGGCVGLVGESGSGKSTLARALLRLQRPAAGRVLFDGLDVWALSPADTRAFRRRAQMIFQDPMGSLNPRKTVGAALIEVLAVHAVCPRAEREAYAVGLLEDVGLSADALDRYPHAFSGGQRQRIGLARALAVNPELLIADEPVSALDVSVQAHILDLLDRLRRDRRLTLLLIAHDLAVVRSFCDSAAILRQGRVVERGDVRSVFERPQHPYTRELIAAVPDVERYEAGARS